MIKNRLVVFIQLVLLVAEAGAQSIWDSAHLAQVKSCLEQPAYATAFHQLISSADRLMTAEPVSVMMKEKAAVHELLKRIHGTDIEKLLAEYHVIG